MLTIASTNCVHAGCEPLQGEELSDHEPAGESAQCPSLQGRWEGERDRKRGRVERERERRERGRERDIKGELGGEKGKGERKREGRLCVCVCVLGGGGGGVRQSYLNFNPYDK